MPIFEFQVQTFSFQAICLVCSDFCFNKKELPIACSFLEAQSIGNSKLFHINPLWRLSISRYAPN